MASNCFTGDESLLSDVTRACLFTTVCFFTGVVLPVSLSDAGNVSFLIVNNPVANVANLTTVQDN